MHGWLTSEENRLLLGGQGLFDLFLQSPEHERPAAYVAKANTKAANGRRQVTPGSTPVFVLARRFFMRTGCGNAAEEHIYHFNSTC